MLAAGIDADTARCLPWVKSGKAQTEQMFSVCASKAAAWRL
jgi:hypothetical protein